MLDSSLIRGVVFDLDGTLVDSVHETAVILNTMRKKRGKLPLKDGDYKKLISHGAGKLVCYALEEKTISERMLIKEFRDHYGDTQTSKDSIYPNVKDTLIKLKQAGIKLAICTNKPKNLCDKVLQDTELRSFFDCVVSGGMTKESKPSREPVDYAMSCLGLSSNEVVFVGDSTVDQRAAKAANVPFVFFSTGYDDGVDDTYHGLVDDMSQLLKLIKLKKR